MPHVPDPKTGDVIYRIGASWDAGDLTFAEAVDKLLAEAPSLNRQGATLQLRAWRSAPSRYRPAPEPPTIDARRLTAAALRRQPIVFKFG